jgi:hypothetical protein
MVGLCEHDNNSELLIKKFLHCRQSVLDWNLIPRYHVCSPISPARKVHAPYYYTRTWPLRLCGFPHYLIYGTIFRKKLWITKCVVTFSTNFSATFLILRRIERDIITNVNRSTCKVPVILVRFWLNLNFLSRFYKSTHTWSIMKIRPAGTEVFREDRWTDRQTDRHDEASGRFSQFCERSWWSGHRSVVLCFSTVCFKIPLWNYAKSVVPQWLAVHGVDRRWWRATHSLCLWFGSTGKVLSNGNSYHVVSHVVTGVWAECFAMNVGAQVSSTLSTETAGYTETIYTASHSRAHWSSQWWSWEPQCYWHNLTFRHRASYI